MNDNAPVVIYTYTRLDHLKKTIAALQANHLASKTDIFVVSDGPKDETAKKLVSELRNYVDSIDGFNAVNRIYREKNVGVFQSVLLAERPIISDYGKLITMEDDIVTSANFLDFINEGLNYYESSDEVYTVSGYCHPINLPLKPKFDSWKSPWFCPWGYGIWKKKYDMIDVEINPLKEIEKIDSKYHFLKKHGEFFLGALESDAQGLAVVADARIAAQMLLMGLSSVMPSKSKVQNIGLDGSGVNCALTSKYNVDLDNGIQTKFVFSPDPLDVSRDEVKQYLRLVNRPSRRRIGLGVLWLLIMTVGILSAAGWMFAAQGRGMAS